MDLADALTANDRIVAVNMYMRRDFRAISSLICLVGLRLNDQYRSYTRPPDTSPILQVRILIECIWASNVFDPRIKPGKGYREGPRLSNVLSSCYRRGLLHRPEKGFDHFVTAKYLQKQCQLVRRALRLINLLSKQHIKSTITVENLKDTQAIWDMPLPDLETAAKIPLEHRSVEFLCLNID